MEIFSASLAICAGNSPVPGEFPSQRPVTRSFDVLFDLHRINGWVNNGEAGDLRRHRAHYDVIVMVLSHPSGSSDDAMRCYICLSYHWFKQLFITLSHDDVIKWKHFPLYWSFGKWKIHRSPVDSPHKDQWCGALMFSLIWACTNGWANNRYAGDLRRHRAHYGVTVMSTPCYYLNQFRVSLNGSE